MLNADAFIKSAEREFLDPIDAEVQGDIPSWINGSLFRNGPAKFEVGEDKYNHYFDGLAMVQKFAIKDGKVTYRSQFLRSNTYKKNMAANRIIISEFGTVGHPDPCKSFFKRYFAVFSKGEATDNTSVHVFPVGDELYCATEVNFLNRIDPTTLDVMEKYDISNFVAVNSATAHPHYEKDGTIHNLGMSYFDGGPAYNIIRIEPNQKKDGQPVLKTASVRSKVKPRWKFTPSYMHSFGITENYFILVESALAISVVRIMGNKLLRKPINTAIQWFDGHCSLIHLLSKETGEEIRCYQTDPFFTFHHINAFEEDGHVVMDVACFKTGKIIQEVSNKQFSRSKELSGDDPPLAKRFVLPLNIEGKAPGDNLVQLPFSRASAHLVGKKNHVVHCEPEVLCDLPMDMPCINYNRSNTCKYRYFYGINFNQSDGNDQEKLLKCDVETKETWIWSEKDCYTSEPVFVPAPDAIAEDDGVLLSAVIRIDPDSGNQRSQFLLVLDAKNMKELGRALLPSVSVPKAFHGSFLPGQF